MRSREVDVRESTGPAYAAGHPARGARPAGQPEKPAAKLLSIIGFVGTVWSAPDPAGGGRPTRFVLSQTRRTDTPACLRKVC